MADTPFTTKDQLVNTSPDTFDGVTDGTINQYIQDAHTYVIHNGFANAPSDIQEQAERFLAIHLFTVGSSSNMVSSEKVGPIQVSYFKAGTQNWLKWLQMTPWGAMYYELWSEYGNAGLPPISLVVLPQ